MTDYRPHMREIARELLGTPNRALSSAGEWRYGRQGSLAVDLEKGCWFDHENQEGGGPLELVSRQNNVVNGEAWRWLEDRFGTARQHRREIAAYDYRNEYGDVVYQVVRFAPKDFRQCVPDGRGGRIWRVKGVRPVPYRLPEMIARRDEPVIVCEGEKDADKLSDAGYLATCNAGGAGKWSPAINRYFRGRNVYVIPDNDEAGERHAALVVRELKNVARSVRVCPIPRDTGLPEKADISDWIARGGLVDRLFEICEEYAAPQEENRPPGLAGAMDIAALIGRTPPERSWLVRDMIPGDDVTMLGGHGGEGKSLLALQLAICAAAGRPWLGLDVRPGRAVYVSCEDGADELWRRTIAQCTALNLPVSDIADRLLPVNRRGMDNRLVTAVKDYEAGRTGLEPSAFLGQLQNLCVQWEARLLVLDSLHNFFDGNENDRPQATQFVGLLRALAEETNGAVLLIAHPSRAGMETGSGDSGNTAWHNSVRARFYMRRDRNEPELRVLEERKQNYGPLREALRLYWQDWIFHRDDSGEGITGGIRRRSAEDAFLELLDRLAVDGRIISPSPNSTTNYAPRAFAREGGYDFTEDEYTAAMKRLYHAGKIKTAMARNANRNPVQGIFRVAEADVGGQRTERRVH